MSENNLNSGNGILVAAVVGAAVGAGIALLFAPCSGRETREWLASRSRDIKDRTTTAFAQGKDSVMRAAKDLGRDVEASTTLRG